MGAAVLFTLIAAGLICLFFNKLVYEKPAYINHRKTLRKLMGAICALQVLIICCAYLGDTSVQSGTDCQKLFPYWIPISAMGATTLALIVWSFVLAFKDKQYVACVFLPILFAGSVMFTLMAMAAASLCFTF